MEEQKSKVLSFISDEKYIPMKAKEIASIMEVPKSEYADFTNILKELVSEYKIQVSKKGKYTILDTDQYKKGKIRINERGFAFVKIEEENDEVYVSGRNRGQALNGDVVLLQIIDNSDKESHKEGKVIKILNHEKNTIVGTFQKSKTFGFVVPDDRKFGSDIFISKKHFGSAKSKQKVVVKITKYPEPGKKAEGEIIEVIGNIDMAGIDMLSLVKEYGLPYEFPEDVLAEARAIGNTISKECVNNRVDLRSQTIFTIDGEDAKDLDDAVCVNKTSDGTYKLIVSIADVSHYVKEGSKLDKEAIIRGTSIYMMDRVIPMLPQELSNGICSLNANEDRLALSVFMEIDNNRKSNIFRYC